MSKICLLYTHDHQSHVIIRRQISTFLEYGFEISVVDQSKKQGGDSSSNYRYVRIQPLTGELVVRHIWRILRRIQSQKLHDWFWKRVLWLLTLSNAIQMARVALSEHPDYYIGEDLQSTWAAILASRIHRRPVLYCAHEMESEQGDPTPFRRQFLRFLEENVIPRVDHLVVPNHSRAAVYSERYRLRTKPTIVQNCPPTTPPLKSNKLRERLGLSESVHVVLYNGALIPYRSLDKLIESAAHFEPDIVLVMIGEQGSYFREILEPICATNQLRGRVFFLAYIPPNEISPYVAAADLGIVIYENINLNNYLCAPTKLYEFMMMKVPVATCNFPELVELFKQYPVGITFDPHDPMSIAKAINSFFTKNRDELATMQSALERARENFTWEKESLKWLALLNVRQDDNFLAVSQTDKIV